ncbi:MAG: aminoacyl-tRNA hydrolase [Armatimonadota bacterium]|nr:aminoacyl-tRNA hydrolase [Armatimonadota bacterium]
MFRRKAAPATPEWLIVGLGNPGGEYSGTRHNVGFEVVRILSERHKVALKSRKFQANYGIGKVRETAVCLVRPMTFMNLSGRAVGALAQHFSLAADRIVVVYDDMDLDLGRVQLKPFGGTGSHNGMKSVAGAVGTQFPRVRIGIGSPTVAEIDHVLSHFDREEIDTMRDAIGRSADACEVIVERGVEGAMSLVNLPRP